MNYLISTIETLTEKDIEYIKVNYPARYEKASHLPKEEQFKTCILAYVLLIRLIGEFNEVNVYYNENKKPYIKSKPYFNISHSGNFVAVVVDNKEVGIDIQKINEDNLKLMKFFNEKDQEYIKETDSVNRFFEIWSKKEAAIKLLGTGLTTPLKDVEILDETTIKVGNKVIKNRYKLLADGYSLCICYQE